MSQSVDPQAQGDFYAPVNRYKQPGDKQPMFKGYLNKPGDEAKLPIALWAFRYTDTKTGEIKTGYSGSIDGVATNIPAADQIEALQDGPSGSDVAVANLKLRPGQIVLFANGFKAEAPDKNRPDLWGWVNPTDGTPPFRPGVWVKTYEDSGRPYLSGSTQYPIPGKSEAEQQPTIDEALASGKVSRGMPKARKEGRGGRE